MGWVLPATKAGGFFEEVRRGFRRTSAVIFALLFKDFRARSTYGRLGIIWTFLESGMQMGLLSAIWYLLGRTEIDGVSVFLVMTASVIPYTLVRRALGSIPRAVASNRNLYDYQQVKPFDAIVARFILEATLVLLSGLALLLIFYWVMDLVPAYPDPLGVMMVLGILMMLSLGLSLGLGVYSTLYEEVDRLLPMLSRPLIFVSCVFHTANQLPEQGQRIVSWNPLAQLNEHVRYYALGMPLFGYADISYAAFVSLLVLMWGMMVYYANRYRILTR